jgi:hypothetical protein
MRHRTRLAWAAVTALAVASPVHAFYWDGWPGASLPRPRTLIPPGDTPKVPPNPTANPSFPPGGQPPGPTPGGPVPPGGGEVPPPEKVPEPASAVAMLIGLGTLATRRLRRG